MELSKLSPEEEAVMVGKGTEAPFSGEYENFNDIGIYLCRRCNTPLYRSENKFDAHCGWPSFDDAIPGAVKRQIDADGSRTEITCATCGAHLGHVFEGEMMTPKDTRYCVNSLSMRFVDLKDAAKKETAIFGGGCFWCCEAIFNWLKGVEEVVSGYAGGTMEEPNYEAVSSGRTGHAEVIKITYDPNIISYQALLDIFFNLHDPTTLNRQGNDVGEQYRSIILFTSERQHEVAKNFIRELEERKAFNRSIVTELKPLEKFYPAEDYHQKYYEHNADEPYCDLTIAPKIHKLEAKYKNLLK